MIVSPGAILERSTIFAGSQRDKVSSRPRTTTSELPYHRNHFTFYFSHDRSRPRGPYRIITHLFGSDGVITTFVMAGKVCRYQRQRGNEGYVNFVTTFILSSLSTIRA